MNRTPRNSPAPAPAPDANAIEKADVAVAQAVIPWRDHPVVKTLGTLSEVGDQPPMIAISALTLAGGLVMGNRRLARAGSRMLASHLLATGVKIMVKKVVDRTRPSVLAEEGRYEMKAGDSDEGKHTSFPSGHTAGAVAVARAFGREYPEYTRAADIAAAAIAAIQIPRCAHYPSDIGAGATIGFAAEVAVNSAFSAAGIAGADASSGLAHRSEHNA